MIYDNTNNLAPQHKAEIFQYTIVTVRQAVLWGRRALWISSDGDDWMGTKLKTQKYA